MPKLKLALLYEQAKLEEDFSLLEINLLIHQQTELSEGTFHRGMASVIRLAATKRNA